MNRSTIEQLTSKAERMQKFLDEEPGNEPNVLIRRSELLGILLSQSGKMLADAKYYKDTIINGAIMEAIQKAYNEKLSPSTINKFVETASKDQNYLVNWIDRINATATHQIDSLRSVLSYRKAELTLV